VRRLVILAVAATCVLGLTVSAHAGAARHFLFAPDASPYGKSLAEWEAAYQIWVNEIPVGQNPRIDPSSPRNCELQDNQVVFLGGFGADCTIPEGVGVAFTPALGFWECSTGEGLGDTYRELRRCAWHRFGRDLDPHVYHQRIWIDGHRLRHQRRWVTLTAGEIVDFPKHNIWGAEPGPSKSVTKGFMFVLRPLSEGPHRIRWVLHHDVLGDASAVWNLDVEPE
jgi:hypothetical protein